MECETSRSGPSPAGSAAYSHQKAGPRRPARRAPPQGSAREEGTNVRCHLGQQQYEASMCPSKENLFKRRGPGQRSPFLKRSHLYLLKSLKLLHMDNDKSWFTNQMHIVTKRLSLKAASVCSRSSIPLPLPLQREMLAVESGS